MIRFRRFRCYVTNIAFKNRLFEFGYLIILSSILTTIMALVSSIDVVFLYKFLIVLSLILAVTSIRQSNCLVFSILTKDLGMSIKDLSKYHSYDYYTERIQISELFKKECIEGILNISNKKYAKKIKITTHRWVYENILLDNKVLNLYEVKAIKKGKIIVAQEVLTLNSNDCFKKYKSKLKKSAYQKRDKYKIILIKK